MPIMRLRNWSRKNQVTYGKDGNPWRTLRSSLASADGRQPSLCERGAPVPSGLRSRFNSGVGSEAGGDATARAIASIKEPWETRVTDCERNSRWVSILARDPIYHAERIGGPAGLRAACHCVG
jgi:hypothetical protein